MANPDIAPSVSPNSIALLVPTAWEDVPIASPIANDDFILHILHTVGARIAPVTPDIITDKIVIDLIPPILEVISTAIAVVTDLYL